MNESISPLSLFLFLNSVLAIGLILNQNEMRRDAITNQNESAGFNLIETLTWGSLFVECILLLVSLKVTDS